MIVCRFFFKHCLPMLRASFLFGGGGEGRSAPPPKGKKKTIKKKSEKYQSSLCAQCSNEETLGLTFEEIQSGSSFAWRAGGGKGKREGKGFGPHVRTASNVAVGNEATLLFYFFNKSSKLLGPLFMARGYLFFPFFFPFFNFCASWSLLS